MTEGGRLLRLDDRDNVLIVTSPLRAGEAVVVDDGVVTAQQDVELGHKVAARAIDPGARVVRGGVPIGSATRAISPGAWVHTHNLQSDYIQTFDHRGAQRG